MRLSDIMKEMALAGYKTHGDFSSPKQFSATDIKLINNKKHYEKVKDYFDKSKYPFSFIMINDHTISDYDQNIGEIYLEALSDSIPDFDNLKRYVESEVSKNHIVVIFSNNNTGGITMPLTSHIMAHRFGHAISGDDCENMIDKINEWEYQLENIIKSTIGKISDHRHDFYCSIGTTAACRKKTLDSTSDSREFFMEQIAQFVLTNTITWNNLTPKLDKIRKDMISYFESELENSKGKIFLM